MSFDSDDPDMSGLPVFRVSISAGDHLILDGKFKGDRDKVLKAIAQAVLCLI